MFLESSSEVRTIRYSQITEDMFQVVLYGIPEKGLGEVIVTKSEFEELHSRYQKQYFFKKIGTFPIFIRKS